jgi:hypothetical protein
MLVNVHKSGPSPSRVYCIFAKSTNSNFPTSSAGHTARNEYARSQVWGNSQFTLLFESRIGNFLKTLLLVSWEKIQYERDVERPDLWINVD